MEQGLITFDDEGEDSQAYPVMLAEAMRYSMDVLGRRYVDREIQALLGRVDDRTRMLAGEYRLLDLML